MNGWTPTIDRKTQHMNHIAACRQFVRENPNNAYWREQLERLGADLHPADVAYRMEQADSAPEREEAEIARTILTDSDWQAEAESEHADWLDNERTMREAAN